MTDEKYIKEATAHFEELLRSQLARCEKWLVTAARRILPRLIKR